MPAGPTSSLPRADLGQALASGSTHLGDDAGALIAASGLDVLVEATGDPRAGLRHALAAIEHGRHLVMVNVETDVLVGPLLAERARKAGLVYSLAYGDQPALICELVDWARASGFPVVCAGKGTRYLPHFHQSTPATVWSHFGITAEQAEAAGMNPKMFNSFIDGTKSAIEMAAVANATGLEPQAQRPRLSSRAAPTICALRAAARGRGRPARARGHGRGDLRPRARRPPRPQRSAPGASTSPSAAPTDYAAACFAAVWPERSIRAAGSRRSGGRSI